MKIEVWTERSRTMIEITIVSSRTYTFPVIDLGGHMRTTVHTDLDIDDNDIFYLSRLLKLIPSKTDSWKVAYHTHMIISEVVTKEFADAVSDNLLTMEKGDRDMEYMAKVMTIRPNSVDFTALLGSRENIVKFTEEINGGRVDIEVAIRLGREYAKASDKSIRDLRDRFLIPVHAYYGAIKKVSHPGHVLRIDQQPPVGGLRDPGSARDLLLDIAPLLLHADFPWKNTIVAGGSIMKVLYQKFRREDLYATDIDIFVYGKTEEEKSATLDTLLRIVAERETYFSIRGCVVSAYPVGAERKYQFVSSIAQTKYDVLEEFDFSSIMVAYDGERFLATAEALYTMQTGVATINQSRRIRSDRVIKTLHCGFSLDTCKLDADTMDTLERILRNPSELNPMISKLYRCYYPRSEHHPSHIAGMIMADAMTDVVVKTTWEAMNEVTISSNFAYWAVSWPSFVNASQFVRAISWKGMAVMADASMKKTMASTCTLRLVNITENERYTIWTTLPADARFLPQLRTIVNFSRESFPEKPPTYAIVDDKYVRFHLPAKMKCRVHDSYYSELDTGDVLVGDHVKVNFLVAREGDEMRLIPRDVKKLVTGECITARAREVEASTSIEYEEL